MALAVYAYVFAVGQVSNNAKQKRTSGFIPESGLTKSKVEQK